MKKRDLWTGIGMIALGLGFLAAAISLDTPLGSLLCGFCGGFVGPGIAQVYKYVRWSGPKHRDEYQARLEQERIDLRDERKAMLRDKSGRYAYVLGMVLTALAVTVFSALDILGVVSEESTQLLVPFLAGYLVVQYLAGVAFYRRLEKKY